MLSALLKISAFLVGIVSIVSFVILISIAYRIIVSKEWPTTIATLTSYKNYFAQTNNTGTASLRTSSKSGFLLDVTYKFEIGSNIFTGNNVDVKQKTIHRGEIGEEFLDLRVGQKIIVKYDKENPNNNYMFTNRDDSFMKSLIKTISAFIISLLCIWYVFLKS